MAEEVRAAGRSRRREVLIFVLDGQRHALWTDDVRELLRAVAVAPLPGAPAVIEGVIDVRGRIVPVLDLRRRFGLLPRAIDPADHLVVVTIGPRLLALRVDRALDIATIDPASLEELRPLVPRAVSLAGVAQTADGLAVIHDLGTFLGGSEGVALDRALAAAPPGAPA
jgi:purine-binding chemotaxis protein CheW